MERNILISFTADTKALDSVSEKLNDLNAQMDNITSGGAAGSGKGSTDSKKVAELKRTVADLKSQNAALEKSFVQLSANSRKSIESLAAQFSSMAKRIQTAALDKYMKQLDSLTYGMVTNLQKAFQTGNINAFAASVEQAKKKLSEMEAAGKSATPEYQMLAGFIDGLTQSLVEANAQMDNVGPSKSLKGELRALREEMAALKLAGMENTEQYAQLQKRAGEMADAIGDVGREVKNAASDTKTFDLLADSSQLAAAGFGAAQGAAALFGSQSSDLEKTMIRLQSAIALTISLQQIQNTLQREGVIISKVLNVQRMAEAAAQNLTAKGTIAATVAQKAFNLIAKANPYLLLATAILSVVGAIYMFTQRTDEASVIQDKINSAEAARIETLNALAKSYKDVADSRELSLQRELDLLKASGASTETVARKEKELLAEKVANAAESKRLYHVEIESMEANRKKAVELEAALRQLEAAKEAGQKKTTFTIAGEIHNVKITDEAKERLQKELDNTNQSIDVAINAKQGFDEAKSQSDIYYAEEKQKALKSAKDETLAAAEVRLLEARKGSEQELAAKIELIAAKRRMELDNEQLTANQRRAIVLNADKAIVEAKANFNLMQLNEEKAAIQSRLNAVKDGSADELKLKKELLTIERDSELANIDLSEKQKDEIRSRYRKTAIQMDTDFNNALSKNALETEISNIESQLLMVEDGTDEEYRLKVDLIEKKRALEAKAIDESVDNEELKMARITEINARAVKEAANLKYDTEVAANDKITAKLEADAADRYANGVLSETDFQNELTKIKLTSIVNEVEARKRAGKNTLDLDKEIAAERIRIEEQVQQRKAELTELAIQTFQTGITALLEADSARIQTEIDNLEKYYTTDVEEAKKNRNLKLISEEQYNRRKEELEVKRKKAEKNTQTAIVLMNAAQSIAKIFMEAAKLKAQAATYAAIPIVGPGLAAAALAMLPVILSQIPFVVANSAMQLSAIKKYASGRKGAKQITNRGELSWVGELGPELMWVPDGAAIVPAHKSRQIKAAFEVMKDFNIPARMPKLPEGPYVSKNAIVEAKAGISVAIDYDKLADKVGERVGQQIKANVRIPGQRPVTVNVDQNGATVTEGNTITHYRNRKYIGHL